MVVKAAIGFLNLDSDDQLIGDVQSAINGLTGNPNFATPAPILAAVSTALAAFTTALADAVNGRQAEDSSQERETGRARFADAAAGQLRDRDKRWRYGETALERFPLPKAS